MIVRNIKRKGLRLAAHTVEFAVVSPIIFMVLFGLFEWCRYIMARNVMENAVREGTRFAVARTDTLQTGVDTARIRLEVNTMISRMGTSVTNTNIKVYKTNVFGEPTDKNGAVVATASAADFDETKFGDYICVEVIGDYKPALPNFLHMGSITKIAATVIMVSEGN
jgi:Flp pilus assembly protein TadG